MNENWLKLWLPN